MVDSITKVRSIEELSALFRTRGLKVTPQRQCVFSVLGGDESHPSADAVHVGVSAVMPSVSLKTVYQTLHDLAAMGEILELDLGTGATRFDPNIETPHHHLVCGRCRKVRDLHADFGDLEVPARSTQGFHLGPAQVTFRGLCPDCTTSPTPPDPPTAKECHGRA